jgi:hypothetical protein
VRLGESSADRDLVEEARARQKECGSAAQAWEARRNEWIALCDDVAEALQKWVLGAGAAPEVNPDIRTQVTTIVTAMKRLRF